MADDEKCVFISHVHEDDAGLGDLKQLLAKNGLGIRDYSINARNPNEAESEDYIKTSILAPRIRACSTLVVYVSERTRESKYVNWEIEYAQKEGKRIVGVWAQGEKGCDIPRALADYANAVVGWNAENIIDAIEGRINDWRQPDGSPCDPRQIKRYNC